jgi:hypothetical protein
MSAHTERPTPKIIPLNGSLASAADVRRTVGTLKFEMVKCPPPSDYEPSDDREVRVTVSKVPLAGLGQYPAVVDALLSQAARHAWKVCPQPYFYVGTRTGDFHYDVQAVEVHGPDGAELFSARLGGQGLTTLGDQVLASSREGYQWLDVRNTDAEARASQAAATQQQAVANLRVEQDAQAQQQAAKDAQPAVIRGTLGIIAVLGIVLFTQRNAILRWYYNLFPHPAKAMVDNAIYNGAEIDGDLYDEVLCPIVAGEIETEVRTEQAKFLVRRLRWHEAALRSEEAQYVAIIDARTQAEIKRENALLRAHTALLEAGIDHEIAAARVEEFRKAAYHDD